MCVSVFVLEITNLKSFENNSKICYKWKQMVASILNMMEANGSFGVWVYDLNMNG